MCFIWLISAATMRMENKKKWEKIKSEQISGGGVELPRGLISLWHPLIWCEIHLERRILARLVTVSLAAPEFQTINLTTPFLFITTCRLNWRCATRRLDSKRLRWEGDETLIAIFLARLASIDTACQFQLGGKSNIYMSAFYCWGDSKENRFSLFW